MFGFTKVAVTLLALCALSEAAKSEKHHQKKERGQMRRAKKGKEGTVLVELGETATALVEDTHSASAYAELTEKFSNMQRQLVEARSANKHLAHQLSRSSSTRHRAPAHEEKAKEEEEESEEQLAEGVHKENDEAIAKDDGSEEEGSEKEGSDSGDDGLSASEKADEAKKEEELGEAYKAGKKAGKKSCGGHSLLEPTDDENFAGSLDKDALISDKLNVADKQLSKARRMLQLARQKFPEHQLTEANLDSLMESDTKDGSGSWGGRRRCNVNTDSSCYCSTRRRGSGSWLQTSDEDGSAALLESENKEAAAALEEAAEEGGAKSGWGGRRRCFDGTTHDPCGTDGDCVLDI